MARRQSRLKAFSGPLAMLPLGIVIVVAAFLWPAPSFRMTTLPLNLGEDGVTAGEFQSPRDQYYNLSIEMDQATAKRLFPCKVDTARFHDPACKTSGNMPVKLAVVVQSAGAEVYRGTYAAGANAGGSYGGDETFALDVENLKLRPGPYQVMVRSLADASALAPARPRLVVEVDPIDAQADLAWRVIVALGVVPLWIAAAMWAGVIQVMRVRTAR